MKERILYKSLVVGIVILFVGMWIQPVIAVTPDTVDNEDDCDLCPSIDNKNSICNFLERILNRFNRRYGWTSDLLDLFGHLQILGYILEYIYYFNFAFGMLIFYKGVDLGCWDYYKLMKLD